MLCSARRLVLSCLTTAGAVVVVSSFSGCGGGPAASGLVISTEKSVAPGDGGPSSDLNSALESEDYDVPVPLVSGPLEPYPEGRTDSPITPEVAQNLQSIAALNPNAKNDVFIKVGDSITVSTWNLNCYDQVTAPDALEPTRQFFLGGKIDDGRQRTTPFGRTSLAAHVGWSVASALRGSPSPLAAELDVANPRFAVIMFGTNDVSGKNLQTYFQGLSDAADQAIAHGTIPILSSIPVRADLGAADRRWVLFYNAVAKGIAYARQVPFVDYYRALLPLPRYGLGRDNIHPNVFVSGGLARACDGSTDALQFGFNLRNALTLQALSRAHEALGGSLLLDAAAPPWLGDGTPESPYIAGAPAFSAQGVSADPDPDSPPRVACGTTKTFVGKPFVYRLELDSSVTLTALLVHKKGVASSLYLTRAPARNAAAAASLEPPASAEACLGADDRILSLTLPEGRYDLWVDNPVGIDGNAHLGEFLLNVITEFP